MPTYPLIFPSLSRQPSMDTSKTIEDDTIRDSMESGDLTTRPRFTRVRRTWPFNVRNLVAEDIRTLDEFFMSPSYAARGSNTFLYPNLLPNWSFEFPALTAGDLAQGWSVTSGSTPLLAPQLTGPPAAFEGVNALGFIGVSGTLAAGASEIAIVECNTPIACTPGDVYLFRATVQLNLGILATYGDLGGNVRAVFTDVNGAPVSTLSSAWIEGTSGGWIPFGFSFTVPAGAAQFSIQIWAVLTNGATGAPAMAVDNTAWLLFDAVGCALQTPLSPYGRMVGSQPLGCLVRFSKAPETADVGWGNGVKVYGTKIELQEV